MNQILMNQSNNNNEKKEENVVQPIVETPVVEPVQPIQPVQPTQPVQPLTRTVQPTKKPEEKIVIEEKKTVNNYDPYAASNAKIPNKSYRDVTINPAIRFFAFSLIIIIIFGLIFSGKGAYAFIENKNEMKDYKEPAVTTNQMGNSVKITASNDVGIRYLNIYWNDSNKMEQQVGNRAKTVTKTVSIPESDESVINKLYIEVVDVNSRTTKYAPKNYTYSAEDTNKPDISFEPIKEAVRIVVTDDSGLDYIEYSIDGGEVKRENVGADPLSIVIEVPVTRGTQSISVKAKDKASNIAEKTQDIKGATKATIDLAVDPERENTIDVIVKDDDQLQMVVIYLNEERFSTNKDVALGKEQVFYVPIPRGENKLIVEAYNVNEQVTRIEETITVN